MDNGRENGKYYGILMMTMEKEDVLFSENLYCSLSCVTVLKPPRRALSRARFRANSCDKPVATGATHTIQYDAVC